ncbi:MAG TPA: hypothetical protein VFK94_06480 [Patescibacteria group bacterium]|nr:hypothetical protein [Patescibacteria group bacterium]
MADSGEVAVRITLTGAQIKRVQLEGKKVKFLILADADKTDTLYADLVRISDGVTKTDLTLTVTDAATEKDWKLPGQ